MACEWVEMRVLESSALTLHDCSITSSLLYVGWRFFSNISADYFERAVKRGHSRAQTASVGAKITETYPAIHLNRLHCIVLCLAFMETSNINRKIAPIALKSHTDHITYCCNVNRVLLPCFTSRNVSHGAQNEKVNTTTSCRRAGLCSRWLKCVK